MTASKKWTEAENLELLRLRDVVGMRWSVFEMPGRTSGACQVQYYAVLSARNKSKKLKRSPWVREPRFVSQAISLGRTSDAPKAGVRAAAIDVAGPYRPTRRVSTATLIVDAELRSRIENGGWFGDPPPGRSALDQKRGAS